MSARRWLCPLLLLPDLIFAAVKPSPPTEAIKVDQVGYLPDMQKAAAVVAPVKVSAFTIRDSSNDLVVFTGQAAQPEDDADSGDRVQLLIFSDLRKAGRYYLDVPDVGRSWDFSIGPDVYRRAFYLAMRGFYGQRCGTAVDLGPEFPGYRHAACHLAGAWDASSGYQGTRASVKGWHDAGDYGRYVVNSGISTGTLLWAYELFADKLKGISLNIPESGNGTPDILNEARWNIEWMLSMQDQDGGVWHKQTSDHFCPFVMPEADSLTSLVIGAGNPPYKTSCATADLAAVAAIAARVYKPFDSAFADRCLRASRQAWAWLQSNPNVTFKNPKGISTGEYGDTNCADERLWAAAELWRSTGDAALEKYFLANYAPFLNSVNPIGPPSWGSVAPFGLWSYALAGSGNSIAAATILAVTTHTADEIIARTTKNPYRVSLATADYIWGSNGVAANYGLELLIANRLERTGAYVDVALDNLHYLLGRNAFSLSWVTQLGEHPFQHPHHRPSGADNNPEPWPGLLSGGPNKGRQDSVMRAMVPAGVPPAKSYIDDQGAYACNEVAINWNAPLVFLLAAMQ